MREIMRPVWVRLQEIQAEYVKASSWSSGMPPEQYRRLMEEQKAEKKVLVEEMIAKLKFAFSNEDFRKLDAYVYVESWEGRGELEYKRTHPEYERTHPGETPHHSVHASESAQKVPLA